MIPHGHCSLTQDNDALLPEETEEFQSDEVIDAVTFHKWHEAGAKTALKVSNSRRPDLESESRIENTYA